MEAEEVTSWIAVTSDFPVIVIRHNRIGNLPDAATAQKMEYSAYPDQFLHQVRGWSSCGNCRSPTGWRPVRCSPPDIAGPASGKTGVRSRTSGCFPEVRDDPQRNDFGAAAVEHPPPFAKGGGLFSGPGRCWTTAGCAARPGPARPTGSALRRSASPSRRDRGTTWSDYRVAVRGDADREIDVRNPTLGQARDGSLVLGYGILEGFRAQRRRRRGAPVVDGGDPVG